MDLGQVRFVNVITYLLLQDLPINSHCMRLGIVVDKEDQRTHCTNTESTNSPRILS